MCLTSNLRLGRLQCTVCAVYSFFFLLRLYYSTQTQSVFQCIFGGRAVYYDLLYGPEYRIRSTNALRIQFVIICYDAIACRVHTSMISLCYRKKSLGLEGEDKY